MESFAALRVRAFRSLAAAYTINEFGNWIGDVALAILVYDHTGSAVATAGLFLALRFAPALLAPPLTTRIEVAAPRVVLPVLYLGEGVTFVLIAFLARHFSLPLVLALAAFDGILAVAAKALIRSVNAAVLSPEGLLRQGNAVLNLGLTLGGAVGPAVAGSVVAGAGTGTALLLDAATFGFVAVLLASTSGLHIDSDRGAGTIGRLRSGVQDSWRRPAVRRLLLGTGAALLFGASVIPIEVIFAKRTLDAGDVGYGLLITAWGIGMVIGATAFAAGGRLKLSLAIGLGMTLMACGYLGLASSFNLLVACAFSAVGGVGNGMWWIAAVTGIQQSIPSSSQSAVMSVLEALNQMMPALGYVLGGAITALSSPRIAYAIAGAGLALIVVAHALRTGGRIASRPAGTDAT